MADRSEYPKTAPSYPVALQIADRLIVVVGGGAVAVRRVAGLVAAGARVRVVAPELATEIVAAAARGELIADRRPFEERDLDGALLAFAATDDLTVNGHVVACARSRGILVNDAAQSARGDFTVPLVERNGPITFALDTGAHSPSFTKRLRDELRERFDERYGRAAQALGRVRTYVMTGVAPDRRAATMAELAARPIDELANLDDAAIPELVAAAVAPGATGGPSIASVIAATRGSALALRQTRLVMAKLAVVGIASEMLEITTRGDQVQDRPLAQIGSDGLFVKELERALRERRADYAVHSCKDLPSVLPGDMQLAAVGAREDPRDAFCSERYAAFENLPAGARVGSSSPRRVAQLRARRPDLVYLPIRGNVDTRLRKLRDGEFDAIVLALAGLHRLGLQATHTVAFDPSVVVPAVGQGVLAVECRADDRRLANALHDALSDPAVEIAVAAERAFLRTLHAGCQAPVGAHARIDGRQLELDGVIAAVDGSEIVRGGFASTVATIADAERMGERLAQDLVARGGGTLLAAPADERPLAGLLVLLPRTQERPSRIAPALRAVGAEVVEASDADGAERALGSRAPDAVLFPSSGSVAAIVEYLAALRARGQRPAIAAMGAASSAAARAQGFPPDVVAATATVPEFVHSVTHHLTKARLQR